jgi:diacylglycerol kinase (ATP)
MRVAAILGLGCSPKSLKPFQADTTMAGTKVEWQMGMPASNDQIDAILLFGGDGTIHRHLGQLVKVGVPVLIVPVGSGNDFARALGLLRAQDSLAAWRKFCGGTNNVRVIDLGLITPLEADRGSATAASASADSASTDSVRGSAAATRYFCCVAGVGLDGEVSRRADRLPRWLRGHGGYALSLAPTILTFTPQPLKILTPAQSDEATKESWTIRSDQPTVLAAFANTPVYGGGMKIAPQAKMDDGLLDVCIVGGVSRVKLLTMFPSVYSGRHLKIREVEYFHSERVRVETESSLAVYADGEYVCQTPAEVGIQRAALRVITL